ncbi:MAG TPA: Crp/Fnr family transcriptional regulator [Lachnospiraceae bacterium]|nr:Crp/Fnr family transcriptional regulator [Lachnospiraceae bacterium]
MNYSFLANTILFRGTSSQEIEHMLNCFHADVKEYKKDTFIYHTGDIIDSIGLILAGSVNIEIDDIWGNKSILDHIECGQIFSETYAMVPGEPLLVNVVATGNCQILFLNVSAFLNTCSNTCPYHSKIIHNLVTTIAQKNLNLSRRIFYTSSKSIRGRLISYLSQQVKQHGSYQFTIPFNRQQLADYLGVDRSALSNELSKMKKEGILSFKKNTFHVITPNQSYFFHNP